MKLENSFTVPVPRNEAWKVLLDVERIAPCMPGATLTSRDGDSFTGTVKVKVGPINLTYGGKASFVSLDEAAGIAVIEGSGKETRGTGTAKATITCRLVDKGASTEVAVDTDLSVTGKPASFGRGVLADVSGKLVDQFAACLSEEIQQGTPVEGVQQGTPVEGVQPGTPTEDSGGPTGDATAVPAQAAAGPILAAAQPGAAAHPGAGQPTATAQPTAPAQSGAGAPTAVRPPRKEAEPINLIDAAGLPVAKRLLPVLAGVAALILLIRALRR